MAKRRASELETIIESMAEAVFVCDSQGKITLTNLTGLALIGEQDNQAPGRLTDYLEALQVRFPDGRPVPGNDMAIALALRGEVTRGREVTAVHPRTHRHMDLLMSASPLRDHAGRIVGGVQIAADITRVRELSRRSPASGNAAGRRQQGTRSVQLLGFS